MPFDRGGDFGIDAFGEGALDADELALFPGDGGEFCKKGVWGTGGVFDVKEQNRAAAVDFKVEITGGLFGFEEEFDAGVTADQVLILVADAADKLILHVEADEQRLIVMKQSGIGYGMMGGAFGTELIHMKDLGGIPA